VYRGRIEEDIQKNTTMARNWKSCQIDLTHLKAYRSPEMVDLYRDEWIAEKVDIWALGCVLFKMLYKFGPFEEGGRLQIINANYRYPDFDRYEGGASHKLIGTHFFWLSPKNLLFVFR
jgi:serine/threonine protein kinase